MNLPNINQKKQGFISPKNTGQKGTKKKRAGGVCGKEKREKATPPPKPLALAKNCG